MAITSLKQLRETAPPEFQSLDDRELIARYSQSAGVPFEQAASYFGVPARGLGREMLTQAAGGAMVDLPRMVGQAAEYLGAEEFGQSLQAGARAREAAYTPDVRGRNVVGEALVLGSRALAPVAATLPLGLVPGGQFVAPAAAAGLFGLSSAQETYQKLIEQGVPEAEAAAAARGTGLIQGVGEAAATYAGARLLKPAMAAVRGAPTTARIAAEATETGVARPFLKGMGVNLAVQPTTEVAQDVGSALVEEAYGAKPEDKLEIARQSALGGAGLTLLLGPLAMGGSIQRSRNAARLKEALDPASNVDPTFRYAAMDRIMEEARRQGVAESDVGTWLDTQLQAEDSLTAELQAQEQEAFRQRVLQRIEAGEPPEIAEASTAQEAQNPEFWRAFEQRVGIAPEGPAPVGLRREQAQEGFDLLRGPRVPGTTEVMPGVYLETPEQPAPPAQPIDLTQPTTTTISQAQLAEEEGGTAPEMLAAQPSAVSVSGVNAPTLATPLVQEQLAQEEIPEGMVATQPAPAAPLPTAVAPGTIATQPSAQAAASLPGQGTGLPPAQPAGGLSAEQQAAASAAPVPPAKPEAPPKDTFTAEDRAKLAQDLSNLEATITSAPGAVQGKLTLPQSVLAGLARMVRTDKTLPGIAYVPKTASEVDTAATQQYSEQMAKIRDAANKVIDAARTMFNFEANLPPTPSKSAIQKKGAAPMTEVEKDATAMREAGVEVDKLVQQRLTLRNAIEELRAAAGSDVNTEAVVAVAKTAIQRAQQKSQPAAKAKMETSRDTLLSRAWAMYKDGSLQTPEQVDVVRGRETRLSTESAQRGAEDQPLVKAATEGYARRVVRAPERKTGESDADFQKRVQWYEAMKEKGVSGILAYLQRHGTGFERVLASAIGRALRNPKRPAPNLQWIPAGEKSYYDPKTDTVALHETESPEVILHEALHAALQWYVYQNPAAAEVVQLEAALKRVLDFKGTVPPTAQAVINTLRAKYGDGKTKEAKLDAILELISYGTTLNEFRNLLKTMPSVQTPENAGFFAGVKVLWKRITALVQKALGVENTLANDILDSSVALLEQASEETNVPQVAQGGRLEAAVQSSTRYDPKESSTLSLEKYKESPTWGINITKPLMESMGFGEGGKIDKKLTEKYNKLADSIVKAFPKMTGALRNISSSFGQTSEFIAATEGARQTRQTGLVDAEKLLGYMYANPASAVKVIDYLNGDKGALKMTGNEGRLRDHADTLHGLFKEYISTLSKEDQRMFESMKFTDYLLKPESLADLAKKSFGMHSVQAIFRPEDFTDPNIDSFLDWLPKKAGVVDSEKPLYRVFERVDGQRLPAAFIDAEQANAHPELDIDRSRVWYYQGVKKGPNGGHTFRTRNISGANLRDVAARLSDPKTTAAERDEATQQISAALLTTISALANNAAAKNLFSAMVPMGRVDGKATASTVVFNSVDEINEVYPERKLTDQNLLQAADDESRIKQIRSTAQESGVFVQLPDSDRYGDLRGKILPGGVWSQLMDMHDRQPLFNSVALNQLMTGFKKYKTVYSPSTMVNNVLTNYFLMLLHGISHKTVRDATQMIYRYELAPEKLTQEQRDIVKAFYSSGAVLGQFTNAEVKSYLAQKLEQNITQRNERSLLTKLAGWAGYETEVAKYADKLKRAGKLTDAAMTELYAAGDNAFRLAAFLQVAGNLQAKNNGVLGPEQLKEAGLAARKMFLDYDIDARWVRAARQSVLPFVSWTYAIMPVLGRLAITRPWAMVNMFAALYAMGAMGDDDEWREKGPDAVRERSLWGMGPYNMYRMPLMGTDEQPYYINLGRSIPFLSLAEPPSGKSQLFGQSWIPSAVTPNGPYIALFSNMLLGTDPFTGKALSDEAAGNFQKAVDRTKATWDSFAPSWASSRFVNNMKDWATDKQGPTGVEANGLALARALGLAVYQYDKGESQFYQDKKVQSLKREFSIIMSKAKRDELQRGYPDYEALDEDLAELNQKLQERIAEIRGEEE